MTSPLPSGKPDFPPLLQPGHHQMATDQIRALCVVQFPNSKTRTRLMAGLEQVMGMLESFDVEGELWIDGSFVTQKSDPEDVDLVLRVQASFYDNANPDQQ